MPFTVNNELTLSCPEGFAEMTPNELERAFSYRDARIFGIRDTERHIVITITWHKVNVFLAALSDPASTLRSAEFRLRRALSRYGFKKTGSLTRTLAGQTAKGFGYSFQVSGLIREGEVWMIRKKNCYYTVYTYARKPVSQENRAVIEGILKSMEV